MDDLKKLGEAMNEAIILRGMVDTLDEQIANASAQIKSNEAEISRLSNLAKANEAEIKECSKLKEERGKKQAELDKRLKALETVGVKLPLSAKFVTGRVSL